MLENFSNYYVASTMRYYYVYSSYGLYARLITLSITILETIHLTIYSLKKVFFFLKMSYSHECNENFTSFNLFSAFSSNIPDLTIKVCNLHAISSQLILYFLKLFQYFYNLKKKILRSWNFAPLRNPDLR